jgi:hypothetical protein
MSNLGNILELKRCPYCNVDKPLLISQAVFQTKTHGGERHRFWRVYACRSCGGAVIANSTAADGVVQETYPSAVIVNENIPNPANEYLNQALDSLSAPAGCVMLSASAVDAMLKNKGYSKGSLYSRIDEAKEAHLITDEMALWAHEVRLDANDPRHADEKAPIPTQKDARKCIDFALALAQFLFVLPAQVQLGLKDASEDGQ